MKKSFIVILIFASFAMKSFGFQSGDLLYTIISSEPPCVRLDGHINGHSAQGELIIPETVTHEDIVYTVTTIKENAFYMSHITSVVFPAGLTTIEACAFESCQLTSLHIPATLTSIGGNAFVDNKFESITVDEANPIYDSRNNCNALINTATNTLITGCYNTIIPHSITVIGSGAFIHCERLKSINIPDCVTRIENNVFEDCDSLMTVVLPASLTFIGNHAFCYCWSISSITTKATIPPAATYNPNDPYYYDTFLGVSGTIPIYIPFGTTQAYSQAPGWNRFSNFIEEEPIIYTDYEPDTCFTLQYPDTIYLDLNQDGNEDLFFYLVWHSAGGYLTFMKPVANWKWSNSIKIDQTHFQPLTETSTINETLYWETGYSIINDLYDSPEWGHFAFQHQDEDGIHYGWAYISCPGYRQFCISSMAYCTIPNYPLIWGQTNITEGIEENKETIDNVFTVYPNPTNGVLFVETQHFVPLPDHNEYRIANMMGQTLLQGHITDETQQINIENLPAGMYFISVGEQTVKFVVR